MPNTIRYTLVLRALRAQVGEWALVEVPRVVDVELPERGSRGDPATRDVARAADHVVIGIGNGRKEIEVDVVEAGTLGRYEPLGDERAEQQRLVPRAIIERGLDRPRCARDQHALTGLDLLEQLPERHRDALEIHEAENRMVLSARELVALARNHA